MISADFDPELRTEISHEIASNAASNAGVKTPNWLFIRGGKGTEGSLWRDGRRGAHVPSTPARRSFSKAEGKTTTYTRTAVFCIFSCHGRSTTRPRLIKCVHRWPDGGNGEDWSWLPGSSVGERSKGIPFELEVKHVLGLELRGVWREDGMQVA